MEYERSFSCGCKILATLSGKVIISSDIHMCPKHKAADALYEALKLTRDNLQTLSEAASHYEKTFSSNLDILNKALTEADGK